MNRYIVIVRVNSLYVRHITTKEVLAGPFPPDGLDKAQYIADSMNVRMVAGR